MQQEDETVSSSNVTGDLAAVLAAASRAMGSSPNLAESFQRFGSEVGQVVPFDRLAIALIDQDHDAFRDAYVISRVNHLSDADGFHKLSGTFLGQVVRSGTTGLITSTDSDAGADAANSSGANSSLQARYGSVLAVPLAWEGQVVGVLTFRMVDSAAYTDEHIENAVHIGTQIAGQVALSVVSDNQLQEIETQLRIRRLEAENRNLLALETARKRFVGMVTHELKNPLTAMLMASEMFSKFPQKAVGEDRTRLLSAIVDNGQRLRRLIDDLGDIARSDLGVLGVEKKRFRLAEWVDDLRQFVKPFDGLYQHPVDVAFVASEEEVWADRDRLTQVIGNLVENSRRYGRNDGHIRVSLEIRDQELYASVTDDGPGMEQADLRRAFEPLFRGSSSERSQAGGSGLGLAITQLIVERHDGVIDVTSSPEKGTTVTLNIPIFNGAE